MSLFWLLWDRPSGPVTPGPVTPFTLDYAGDSVAVLDLDNDGGMDPDIVEVLLDYDYDTVTVLDLDDDDGVLSPDWEYTLDFVHQTSLTLDTDEGGNVATDVTIGPFNKGSVERLVVTLKKDGVAWAGIDSASLVLEKPDRETRVSKSMTLLDDATGKWYYQTTTTDLDTAGYWTATVEVTDGGVVKRYPHEIGFEVTDRP
jgi:hypothetical protein